MKCNKISILAQNSGRYSESLENIDVLKFLLAILIILRHCGQSLFVEESLFNTVVTNTISPVAVPTFFLISGYLLWRKPVTRERLKKQLWRILRLYLVWTVIFLPLTLMLSYKQGKLNLQFLIKYLQQFLFSGSYYHLWYLPSLIVAIVIVYKLKKIKNRKIAWMFAVFLFLLGALTNTYYQLIPGAQPIIDAYKMVFITTRNGLFFGTVFVLIGAELSEKYARGKETILLIIAIIFMTVEGFVLNQLMNLIIVNIMISSLILAPALFMWFLHRDSLCKTQTGGCFRKMSTIMYCIHPLIIFAVERFTKGHSLIATLLTLGVSLGVSYILTKIKCLSFLM